MDARRLDQLRSMVRGYIAAGTLLRNEISFRVGGPVGALVEPADINDLARVLDFAQGTGTAVGFLGGGSNVLVLDTGFPGLLLRLGCGFRNMERRGSTMIVGAGVSLARVVTEACHQGLGGIEDLAGIPGTVGGALAMNAGAAHTAVGDLAEWVQVVDGTGKQRDLLPEEAGFHYRGSRIQQEGWLVIGASLALHQRDPAEIRERMAEVLHRRRASQPLGLSSAGSVFKNLPGNAAGYLLERAGVKGMRYGGAEISDFHANFIVNRGGARSSDILWLIRKARYLVWRESGALLEPEIKLIGGRWEDILPPLV